MSELLLQMVPEPNVSKPVGFCTPQEPSWVIVPLTSATELHNIDTSLLFLCFSLQKDTPNSLWPWNPGSREPVEPVCVQGHSLTKVSSWWPNSGEDKNEVRAGPGLLLAKTKIQERFCQSLLTSLHSIWFFFLFFSATGWDTPVNYPLEEFSLQCRSFAN